MKGAIMRSGRLHPILLIIVTAKVFLGIVSTGLAQTLFAIETPKRPTFDLTAVGTKLAPELRPSVAANAPFLGLTRKGDPVVQFSADTQLQSAKARISTANLPATLLSSGTGVVAVKRLVVFMIDPTAPPPGASIANLRVVERYSVRDVNNRPGGFIVLEAPETINSESLRELVDNSSIRYVEPSFPFYIDQSGVPNDPEYAAGKLWGLKNINARTAWTRATDSPVIIAVLDSGVDYAHVDLAANIWTGANNQHGYSFINDNADPKDQHGHGTHVSGIIGAVGNNSQGVVGVNWNVKVMMLQIFGEGGKFAGAEKVAQAIDFAISNGAKVVNNSWGGPNFSEVIKEAINRAEKAGMLFIAAAGNNFGNDNDALPIYPGSFANSNIIAVGSIDPDEKLSSFSNVGKTSVHMAAPGGGIYSTLPNSTYGTMSGTSMATPYVTGAAALVWGLPEHRSKNASAIKKLLLDSARPLGALQDKSVTGATLDLSFVGPEAKLTVAAPSAPVTVSGTLMYPHAALGAETTGVAIQTPRGTFEIASPANRPGFKRVLEELNGEPITITGEKTTPRGVEHLDRKVLEFRAE